MQDSPSRPLKLFLDGLDVVVEECDSLDMKAVTAYRCSRPAAFRW